MRINVWKMPRTPHRHIFGSRINGRDVCDSCPFRAKRGKTISAFDSDKPIYAPKTFAAIEDLVTKAKEIKVTPNYLEMTVPQLKASVIEKNPEARGLSKMRKDQLVEMLTAA